MRIIMILKSELQGIVSGQLDNLKQRDPGIPREKGKGINHNRKFIKIISGIRRCGKSTLLHQIMQRYDNFFYLNFEAPGLSGFNLNDFSRLNEIVRDAGTKNLFFDEIQNVEGWERYIRSKHDEGFNIYLTGSNASMLSTELGTRLTGRYLLTELFPFSYGEYLSMKGYRPGKESTEKYMGDGGFPEYLDDPDHEYLYRLFYDIIYRDVAVRHKIRHVDSLKELSLFLISNSGKRISYNRIKNAFSFGSTNTVIDYISFFSDSYLFFLLPKFDYSVKKQLVNERKIYSIDPGLSSVNSASFSDDTGRRLENIVFLHLRRKYRDLFYYGDKYECDFLIRKKPDESELVQVCLELTPDNIDRELNGIAAAMDYSGNTGASIVTLDQKDHLETGGHPVNVIPFHEFAL
jgi:predicted AAA+ superfamily ATPase